MSHLSEWLSSINQQTVSVGEDVEKREPRNKLKNEARKNNEVKTVSSINGVGQTRQIQAKRKKREKLDHFLKPYTKLNSK